MIATLPTPHRTIVLLSGGIDSTVLLYYLLHRGHKVRALSVNYKQRHCKELTAASSIARRTEVEHRIADLSSIANLLSGSALTSGDIDVPLGHYEDETMKLTIVPNRNMLLLSLATAWAISSQFDAVAYAAHSGDHAIYPDCRSEFATSMEQAIALCDWRHVKLLRPFVDMTKADIVRLGHELGVPFEATWSCYQGSDLHCGKCGTCVERQEAFVISNVDDPTTYMVE